MWYPATVITQPTSEPISIDDVRAQSRVGFDDDDAIIGRLISAARDHVEHYCNVLFASQTVSVKCDSFNDMMRLPVAPVASVRSITYIDVNGEEQDLDDDVYELRADGLEASINLQYGQSWPMIQRKSRITVTMIAGTTYVPPAVKHAMLLWISDAYEQRENSAVEDWTALDSLLCNFRYGV